jgi:hypothetical protein
VLFLGTSKKYHFGEGDGSIGFYYVQLEFFLEAAKSKSYSVFGADNMTTKAKNYAV